MYKNGRKEPNGIRQPSRAMRVALDWNKVSMVKSEVSNS